MLSFYLILIPKTCTQIKSEIARARYALCHRLHKTIATQADLDGDYAPHTRIGSLCSQFNLYHGLLSPGINAPFVSAGYFFVIRMTYPVVFLLPNDLRYRRVYKACYEGA